MITRSAPSRLSVLFVQAFRYGLIGLVNTGVAYVGFLAGLVVHLSPQVALVLGTLLGSLNSFVLNRIWTFRSARRPWQSQVSRFAAVAAGVWVLNAGMLEVLLRKGWGPELAQLACLVVTTAVGFVAHRRISFGGGGAH